MKKVIDFDAFRNLLKDGMSIMVGGFMAVGTPEPLIDEIVTSNVQNLTIICNDAGLINKGVGKLIANNQVKTLIASHIGLNPMAGEQMMSGAMQVTLVPQGTLAEQIRAGGAGLGGVLTKTGLGTIVEAGKEVISIQGEKYLLELPMKADLAILRGSVVDYYGNIIYHATTRNFNPVMATACDTVVVWPEHFVEEVDKEKVMTPHIFVDYIVRGTES